VATITASTRHSLVISARVEATGGQDLTGPVYFLLHPTLGSPLRTVSARQGRAEINFTSGGWFTLVAIMDGGATVLAYSLQQLPGAPEWFKES
jgi:hypothetical protein